MAEEAKEIEEDISKGALTADFFQGLFDELGLREE